MQRIGAVLWPKLQCIQIYGANTNVGKTVVSTLLCSALSKKANLKTYYLKPVSTGPQNEADNSHITKFALNVSSTTLFQFTRPVSPHLAVRLDGKELSDSEIQLRVHQELSSYAGSSNGISLVETAGGVLSPAPSGNPQADVYRPLRLPVLLVADAHLGGIATSISAFESLHVRGYDVDSIVLFEDDVYKNVDYLREYFEKRKISTFGLPPPPKQLDTPEEDSKSMGRYYSSVSNSPAIQRILETFTEKHEQRLSSLRSMAGEAHSSIWYPFTQHQGRTEKDIMAIDSAFGDDFASVQSSDFLDREVAKSGNESILQPSVDSSASWWTQGLGHGNPTLSLAASYAAGRYGHVMFASAINEPSLCLAQMLLKEHKNPRLAKVYYTDNGSTGMEVAIKMGLRASCVRYDWDHRSNQVEVLGLKGSYHGDTMGVIDASEPSVYNDRLEWYKPKGYWFDFPCVKMKAGKWVVEPPSGCESEFGEAKTLANLEDIFDLESRDSSQYEHYIKETLHKLVVEQGRKFGALLMEPVILGAGGMFFADPLFQHTLIKVIRENPSLINASTTSPNSEPDWSGLPIIFDEVFTGLYRLGRFNCSTYLQAHPDIIVNAKLLTGGLVPLCTTASSQSIFNAFLGDEKAAALLHGHSYTAHAVGCTVAIESLKTMLAMEQKGSWNVFKKSWSTTDTSNMRNIHTQVTKSHRDGIWSIWSYPFICEISHRKSVEHVIALGSVLAISLKDESGSSGYSSNVAQSLHKKLLVTREGWNIHSRVLGNVIYFMSGQMTTVESLRQVEERILSGLV